MDWIPTVLMVMVIVLFAVQGVILVAKPAEKQGAAGQKVSYGAEQFLLPGMLNCFLALAAFIAYFFFRNGSLILSPEFAVLIAQGIAPWLLIWVTVVVVSVEVGMVLRAIRCARGLPGHGTPLAAAGLVVGILTASRIKFLAPLDPLEPEAFRISCIDLWSYFFLAWIVAILTLWFLTAVERQSHELARLRRFGGLALTLSLFGLMATHHAAAGFVFADSWTLPLWKATATVGVPAAMGIITWSFLGKGHHRLVSRVVRVILSTAAALAGLGTAGLWVMYEPASGKLTRGQASSIVIWGVWAFLLLCVAVWRSYRSVRRAEAAATASAGKPARSVLLEIGYRALRRLPDLGGTGRDVAALVSLAAMAASIFDLCHAAFLDPIWDLTALIASWTVLSELMGDYPLWCVHRGLVGKLMAAKTPIKALGEKLSPGLSLAARPFRFLARARLVIQAVAVVVSLVVLTEIPNAGTTLVQTFTSSDLTASKDSGKAAGGKAQAAGNTSGDDFGRAVSERVVNTLGLVGQEIKSDLLLSSRKGAVEVLPPSADQSGDVQAALGTNNLQIPSLGISISLGFLVTWVQWPVRRLLAVRVIHGGLQKDGERYVLLANSSRGQTWSVASSSPPLPLKRPGKSLPLPPCTEPAPAGTSAVVAALGDGLAYQIISSDPKLQDLGIGSAEAFPSFRAGVALWSRFDNNRANLDALSGAIDCFHRAVEMDPGFALAYYRLGQAYLVDGQPRAAVEAFRQSVSANPRFVAAHIELAETLLHPDRYYFAYQPPAAVGLADLPGQTYMNPTTTETKAGWEEERHELEFVLGPLKPDLTVSWKAAAYLGLCGLAWSEWSTPPSSAEEEQRQEPPYSAFFYCRRAEYLFSRLPAVQRARIKSKETYAFYYLGSMLQAYGARHSRKEQENEGTRWVCSSQGLPAPSSYLQAAARYYQRVSEMQPDNAYLACIDAMARFVRNDATAMDVLDSEEQPHLDLAGELVDQARSAMTSKEGQPEFPKEQEVKASLYGRALAETGIAIERAAYDPTALNDFAYYTWEWWWANQRRETSTGPNAGTLTAAVEHAKESVRLTEDKGLRSDHGTNQSSLGELSLASGDLEGALSMLREIFHPETAPGVPAVPAEPDVSKQAQFDEIRLDYAQACICANSKKWPAAMRNRWASEALKQIEAHERRREVQRFPEEYLKLKTLRQNCSRFSRSADPPDQARR
jgi:tetratricopeptide (TPR) repeat protein